MLTEGPRVSREGGGRGPSPGPAAPRAAARAQSRGEEGGCAGLREDGTWQRHPRKSWCSGSGVPLRLASSWGLPLHFPGPRWLQTPPSGPSSEQDGGSPPGEASQRCPRPTGVRRPRGSSPCAGAAFQASARLPSRRAGSPCSTVRGQFFSFPHFPGGVRTGWSAGSRTALTSGHASQRRRLTVTCQAPASHTGGTDTGSHSDVPIGGQAAGDLGNGRAGGLGASCPPQG